MRVFYLVLAILLAGCTAGPGQANTCPATEAARLTPPDDESIASEPVEGAYKESI